MESAVWLGWLLPAELMPWQALGLVALSFLTSLMTASVGIGGGLVLIAVMVSFLPPVIVLPVHGLVQLGSNAGRAYLLRGFLRKDILLWFTAGGVVGIIVAANTFVALPVVLLEAAIALFVLFSVWAPTMRRRQLAPRSYAAVGATTTFASMFVGGTGSLVAAFLTPERLGRDGFVATHATCMSVQHLLKVFAFAAIGFHFAQWAAVVTAMVGGGFLGTVLGRQILGCIPEAAFRILFRMTMTLLAVRLLYNSVTHL